MIELITAAIIAMSTLAGTPETTANPETEQQTTTTSTSTTNPNPTPAPIGTGGWDDNGFH